MRKDYCIFHWLQYGKESAFCFFILSLCLLINSSTYAQLRFSGDASLRGRYDITDYNDYGNTTEDFYFMYRARLNIQAEIGEGWFFKTQLAHAGNSNFAYVGSTKTESRIPGSIDGSIRPGVHFNQLYFGRATEDWTFYGGMIPLNGNNNPMLDLHFYSEKMVDIPYALYSSNAAFGFSNTLSAGPGKVTTVIMIDNNKGKFVEDPKGNSLLDTKDGFTFGIDYDMTVADFSIQPLVYFSTANDSTRAPFTMGLNLRSPKFAGIVISSSAGYSNQDNKGTTEYDAWFLRLKANIDIGPGNLEAWYDLANRNDKLKSGDISHDFTYLWIKYKLPIFKGKLGSVDIEPTARIATEKVTDKMDYGRSKFEITSSFYFN